MGEHRFLELDAMYNSTSGKRSADLGMVWERVDMGGSKLPRTQNVRAHGNV
jgi:hypothetical protein